MQLAILPDTIEHDDRVVDRKSDECQQRRDHVKTDLDLEDRKETERDKHVVKHRDHRRSAVGPLKSERDIDQDSDERSERYGDRFVSS